MQDFREAIEKFKEDIPKVTAAIRNIIEAQQQTNAAMQQAEKEFLELCKASINPSITADDVKEMMIQHILSADIFNTIFDEPHFHQENNIAREVKFSSCMFCPSSISNVKLLFIQESPAYITTVSNTCTPTE